MFQRRAFFVATVGLAAGAPEEWGEEVVTASATRHRTPQAREESDTTYRADQFQTAVALKPGENLLVSRLEPLAGQALLSVLFTGPRNDGDTAEGIEWIS